MEKQENEIIKENKMIEEMPVLCNETETSRAEAACVQEQVYVGKDGNSSGNIFTQACTQSDLANMFEQKQIQYLMGRRSVKVIMDKSGNVIIREGETISQDIINLAKESGCFIDLIMNNKS